MPKSGCWLRSWVSKIRSLVHWLCHSHTKPASAFKLIMVYFLKKSCSISDQLPTYSRTEPWAKQTEDQVEVTLFSVLSTHRRGGKKSILNRTVSGVCQKHCPAPLHLQAGAWQKVMAFSSSSNFLKRNTAASSKLPIRPREHWVGDLGSIHCSAAMQSMAVPWALRL